MALLANILLARSVEGRLRALHVAKARPPRRERVGAACGLRASEAAGKPRCSVRNAEVPDHVVLVDAVARDADRPDEHVIPVDRSTPREDLRAVAKLRD